MLLGLALATMIRTGDSLADDRVTADLPAAHGKSRHAAPAAVLSKPQLFKPPSVDDHPTFSSTDFTPRKHSIFDADQAPPSFTDAPMLDRTSTWERLSAYRSQDRVRLLTLWESSGSSLSVQAGHHGGPSLQWTSRLMDRGGATQGLLDRWLSASLERARSGLHYFGHTTDSQKNPKPDTGPAP